MKHSPKHPDDLHPTEVYKFTLKQGMVLTRIFVSTATHSKRGLVLIVTELDEDRQQAINWKDITEITLIPRQYHHTSY